jgi:hypothetical protein
MGHLRLFLATITVIFVSWSSHALSEERRGSWLVNQYAGGATLISSLNVYGQDSGKGPIPTFMLNHGNDGCLVSFGLTLHKNEISPDVRNMDEVLSALKSVIKQSSFYVDGELLEKAVDEAQSIDMGEFLYARTLIDNHLLSAFMSASNGGLQMNTEDAGFYFDMNGFQKIMTNLIDQHCS